jgi:hypothetical protein
LRRVHVLAAAGAALLLASCSGQPNDLRDNQYYEDAETPEYTAPPSATSPLPVPAAAPVTPSRPDPGRFALRAADLAGEGVQQTGTADRGTQAALPDCAVPLPDTAAGYQTAWAYPTGATLRQYVADFDDDAGAVVDAVRDKLTCGKYRSGGTEITVRAPVSTPDGQVSWCAASTKQSACTVLKADGPRLSVIVVTAATEAKAKQAVTRIAPLAATALTGNS